MVLDSSAVIAILQSEPDSDRLLDLVEAVDVCRISSATLLETAIVMFALYGDAGERETDLFLHRLRVEVISVTEDHVDIARSAYRRFGKGQHPAGLNFGDCFSYALSRALGEPLLFTGGDFALTDVLQVRSS